ncbi:MAG TPA: glycosyltransferase 87 family protein [Solirubrobacteraceae bacterium]|nr:glycosyltransferase 87 family protein [Solirubrobacteraceae bacterium]
MRLKATVALLVVLALPGSVATAAASSRHGGPSVATPASPKAAARISTASTSSTNPIPVPLSDTPPAGRRLSANKVLAIASALPKMRAERAKYRGSFGGAYLKAPLRWQVSFFSHNGKKEIGQVIIDDLSGRVLEQWTGFQVAWSMARGYPGAFGRHVNALYIWLPLCLLFALPFFNFRRPFSLSNIDLLALLSFSVSLAFFNHANIYASVPLTYPPLLYLLVRMLTLLRRTRSHAARRPPPLRLLVPASWLAVAVVFLLGFRIGLNVTDANVIDVGYAGVIGAQRITTDRPLYGSYPSDNERGDTYGPFNYEAYVPFEQLFGWSGKWDDLPAAHAAAIVFDLLAVGLLFLLGRRMRGPTLGIALAYAWVSYPFTLYSLESNSNDSLVAVLIIAALLSATYRSRLAPAARGAFTALAGLTKLAPLALAPLLATHELVGQRSLRLSRRAGAVALFTLAFLAAAALALVPAVTHDSLHTIYERTIAYQANRGSPFSVWGLYGGLGGLQLAVQIAAVVLALALALIPRRADLVGLAAACGAVIIAVQLGIEHWFYLYIPWFFPLVIVALLGRFSEHPKRKAAEASTAARSSRPVAALST